MLCCLCEGERVGGWLRRLMRSEVLLWPFIATLTPPRRYDERASAVADARAATVAVGNRGYGMHIRGKRTHHVLLPAVPTF
jgi:hypothetical protein